MENVQNNYDITSFEYERFILECLEAFDEDVANIEEEYAVIGNSYRHDALCGKLSTDTSSEELRDEYVSEKYGV